jgi:hypothetical protein
MISTSGMDGSGFGMFGNEVIGELKAEFCPRRRCI